MTNTTTELNGATYFLDTDSYNPDTLDLDVDLEARDYWLRCFGETVKKFAIQAARSQQAESETATGRAEDFQNDYLDKLNLLKDSKSSLDGK